jgi:putative transposase
MATKIQHIRTLRLKVKAEGYAWLNAAAIEVNQVWNFANATSYKAARPFAGQPKWLTAFDLDKLTAGASKCFERIGADTIQRVNAEYATRRQQFKLSRLKWRVSKGAKRSLGWVPFKAVQLKRKGKSLRFLAKPCGSLSVNVSREPRGNAAALHKIQSVIGGFAYPSQ